MNLQLRLKELFCRNNHCHVTYDNSIYLTHCYADIRIVIWIAFAIMNTPGWPYWKIMWFQSLYNVYMLLNRSRMLKMWNPLCNSQRLRIRHLTPSGGHRGPRIPVRNSGDSSEIPLGRDMDAGKAFSQGRKVSCPRRVDYQ